MFSGRISLTIICKNQSVSINFEIAAVKKWPVCDVPFVFMNTANSNGAVTPPVVHKGEEYTSQKTAKVAKAEGMNPLLPLKDCSS